MGIWSKLREVVAPARCPRGCGAELPFCRCGDGGTGDRKLTNRAKQTRGGRVVKGKPTGGHGAR